MSNPATAASFATTRWTLVLAAAERRGASLESSPETNSSAHAALAELCRVYWPPLYTHARRRGLAPAAAEDAVQGFFARLLRLESLGTVQRERGRFRAFLLGSFNHHLADLHDHATAEKRGTHLLVTLDTTALEAALAAAPAPDLPPDRAFDRAWALALLATVTAQLRAEHTATGRAALFDALRPALAGRSRDAPHAALAAQLGLSEAAVRVAVHRLRGRFRALLRTAIAETVATPAEVDDELRHLRAALAG